MEKSSLTVLSERYSHFILLSLYENGTMKVNDFDPVISTLETLKKVISALEEDGLIVRTKETSPYRVTKISLTERGKKTAAFLELAEAARMGVTISHTDARSGALYVPRAKSIRQKIAMPSKTNSTGLTKIQEKVKQLEKEIESQKRNDER